MIVRTVSPLRRRVSISTSSAAPTASTNPSSKVIDGYCTASPGGAAFGGVPAGRAAHRILGSCQTQAAKALRIGDGVDFDDPAAGDGESPDGHGAVGLEEDGAGGAVDDRRAHDAGGAG